MKILHLDSSVTGANSITRPLTQATVARLVQKNPDAQVLYRDLADEPLNHYTAVLRIHGAKPDTASPAQLLELELGEQILAEFLAVDTIVIGAPMYNGSIPSQLKAWIDRILVKGETFTYGENGPEGLAGGKRVIVAVARGNLYGPGDAGESYEHLETYLRAVFGFIGIVPEIVAADGIGFGPDHRAASIEKALGTVSALAA